MKPGIDYSAVFEAIPAPCMLLDSDLVIVAVNDAFARVTGRDRNTLLGWRILDAFPENPQVAGHSDSLEASLQRVLRSRQSDTILLHRHDLRLPRGTFEERWWTTVNVPIPDAVGDVSYIITHVMDATPYVQDRRAYPRSREAAKSTQAVGAQLYARAEEQRRLYEELRAAHAEERTVALALQRSMLYAPDLERHKDLAVRYLPAGSELNVCGDWYDVADLSEEHLGAAVGDVVGHGLEAAMVMGMLRSALSAAIRASEGPARALQALGMYAESVEGALGTTAVKVLINKPAHLITYSSAGHPPPILLHRDGTWELLDKATDPPLGVWSGNIPRSQASLIFTAGDHLVLYTDGLIEKPEEDIDVGITRLANSLSRCVELSADQTADTILDDLGAADGARDDIALMVICV